MRRFLIPCLPLALSACSSMMMPPPDKSAQTRINTEMKQAAAPREKAADAPLPQSVSTSLLPPLQVGIPKTSSRQLEQRFDLVVTDAPIGQVLMAIVSDTRYSVLLSPKNMPPATPVAAGGGGGTGQVVVAPAARSNETLTVKLKDVTVFEALDAIREMYGYEYSVDGTRIYVQPPEMRTKLYQVNYILGQRRGVSDIQVIGGASTGSSSSSSNSSGTSGTSGSGSGSSGTSSNYSSIQASGMSTISKSDVWGEMEDAVRTALGCHIARSQPTGGSSGGGSTGSTGGSTGSSSSGSGNSSRADVSFVGDNRVGERMRGVEGCSDGRAMAINQTSGTVLVRGLPRELRMIESMLRSMQINIERQVIIEAKIIDVELNAGAQQGINWSAFSQGLHRASVGADTTAINGVNGTASNGTINSGTSLGSLLGNTLLGVATPNAFSAGLGVALQFTNFSALINFLQTQGNVQVLSSPRIATLNNQKAVIKVGSEEPFVTNITGGTVVATSSTSTTNGPPVVTPPTLNYQPFFSGISLDVTPQIDEYDNITLHVHSMVNSIVEKLKLSLPTAGAAMVPFAVNSVSETDSVVKTKDSQVVVIGGLMTESFTDSGSKVPGVGDVPGLGAMFGKSGRQSVKRELVILLKPTVVKGDNAWSNDIAATQGRIERMNSVPQGQPPTQ